MSDQPYYTVLLTPLEASRRLEISLTDVFRCVSRGTLQTMRGEDGERLICWPPVVIVGDRRPAPGGEDSAVREDHALRRDVEQLGEAAASSPLSHLTAAALRDRDASS